MTNRHGASRHAAGRHGASSQGSGRQGTDRHGASPQATGRHRRDPTAGFVADRVAAKDEASRQQEANENEPKEQPEEPAQVRPFEVHLNYGRPNAATSNIELESLEWRLNSV